ncbi:MAG TPA: hypothetical protein VGE74_17910 [Gemmata sp.]
MGKPIVEFITADVVAAVAAVTTPNGYSTTLVVSEPDAEADSPQDSTAEVVEAGETPEESPPMGFDGVYQDYDVVVFIQDGGTDSTFNQRRRAYSADVRRAVMADEERGGYARWTRWTGSRPFQSDRGRGVVVSFQVYYRTVKDQPDRLN